MASLSEAAVQELRCGEAGPCGRGQSSQSSHGSCGLAVLPHDTRLGNQNPPCPRGPATSVSELRQDGLQMRPLALTSCRKVGQEPEKKPESGAGARTLPHRGRLP